MKKYELSWKDFDREDRNEKRTALIEIVVFIFFVYFLLSLVSFWQFVNGEVPYSEFWHAPWRLLINMFF